MAATAAVEIYSKVRVSEAVALSKPLHKLSREAIPNKQPQSQGVMEDFTGTVDGRQKTPNQQAIKMLPFFFFSEIES